jgi:hypothetical protein
MYSELFMLLNLISLFQLKRAQGDENEIIQVAG